VFHVIRSRDEALHVPPISSNGSLVVEVFDAMIHQRTSGQFERLFQPRRQRRFPDLQRAAGLFEHPIKVIVFGAIESITDIVP